MTASPTILFCCSVILILLYGQVCSKTELVIIVFIFNYVLYATSEITLQCVSFCFFFPLQFVSLLGIGMFGAIGFSEALFVHKWCISIKLLGLSNDRNQRNPQHRKRYKSSKHFLFLILHFLVCTFIRFLKSLVTFTKSFSSPMRIYHVIYGLLLVHSTV